VRAALSKIASRDNVFLFPVTRHTQRCEIVESKGAPSLLDRDAVVYLEPIGRTAANAAVVISLLGRFAHELPRSGVAGSDGLALRSSCPTPLPFVGSPAGIAGAAGYLSLVEYHSTLGAEATEGHVVHPCRFRPSGGLLWRRRTTLTRRCPNRREGRPA
jgi:hypothetical protein